MNTNSSTAEDLYLAILDDYTTTDQEVSNEAEDFLNGFENLTSERRKVILLALQRKGINTVKKLEAELLRIGPDIAKSFYEHEAPLKNNEPVTKSGIKLKAKDKINSVNVGVLLEKCSKHPTILMLLELESDNQVKALNKAGILVVGQLDTSNDILMRRLKDSVGSVLSGISPTRGAKSFEISTPTGSGKNR